MKKELSSNKDEIEMLTSLLTEYSSKLITLADQWNAQRRRMVLWGFLLVFVLISIMVASSIFGASFEIKYLIYYIEILILTALISSIQIFRLEIRKLKSTEENIHLLESKLEKLVRKASQIEEHVEKDKGRLLELDLKLAEAEGSLRTTQQIHFRRKQGA